MTRTSELLIIQSGDDAVEKYLTLSYRFHASYAARCHADYLVHNGRIDPAVHPAWNRVAMIRDAFNRGYKRVLWLDSDTFVVRPEVNVFTFTSSSAPVVMRRTSGGFFWPPDDPDMWEGYNDGVLLMNRNTDAVHLLDWWWAQRNATPEPWHSPSLWELNWLLDFVKTHPSWVVEMMDSFNWQPFENASPEELAVIKAWHGMPHEQRWSEFRACVEQYEALA